MLVGQQPVCSAQAGLGHFTCLLFLGEVPTAFCHDKTYFWAQLASSCLHSKPTARPPQDWGSPSVTRPPHPPKSPHTQPSAPGARALIPAKGAVCHGIPLPGLKACGLYVSSEVLQAIQQPGPERAVQGGMGCVRASACTEANLSLKSQCKTICDSHFFINAGSARWQPPSPPQTRHGFPAGAAGVPPCPPVQVSWGSQLASHRI